MKTIILFHPLMEGFDGQLKTGLYYLRQPSATDPINFALDTIVVPTPRNVVKRTTNSKIECNEEVCTACKL
jgi:hypothetical protein